MGERRTNHPDSRQPPISQTDPQWERANQAWSLHVDVDSAQLTNPQRRVLCRILRVKKTERSGLWKSLPGIVRRGARIDLETLESDLRSAGFDCHLKRSSSA